MRINLRLLLKNPEHHSSNLFSLHKTEVDMLSICGIKPQDVFFYSWACICWLMIDLEVRWQRGNRGKVKFKWIWPKGTESWQLLGSRKWRGVQIAWGSYVAGSELWGRLWQKLCFCAEAVYDSLNVLLSFQNPFCAWKTILKNLSDTLSISLHTYITFWCPRRIKENMKKLV